MTASLSVIGTLGVEEAAEVLGWSTGRVYKAIFDQLVMTVEGAEAQIPGREVERLLRERPRQHVRDET